MADLRESVAAPLPVAEEEMIMMIIKKENTCIHVYTYIIYIYIFYTY